MNLQDLFKRDLTEITKEVGSNIIIRGKNGSTSLMAIVSDYNITSSGYAFVEGQEVNATCQFDGDKVAFTIVVGDKVIADGVTYRVSTITRTKGDSSVTLALVVEGKR